MGTPSGTKFEPIVGGGGFGACGGFCGGCATGANVGSAIGRRPNVFSEAKSRSSRPPRSLALPKTKTEGRRTDNHRTKSTASPTSKIPKPPFVGPPSYGGHGPKTKTEGRRTDNHRTKSTAPPTSKIPKAIFNGMLSAALRS
jgi:hypothetical protein